MYQLAVLGLSKRYVAREERVICSLVSVFFVATWYEKETLVLRFLSD